MNIYFIDLLFYQYINTSMHYDHSALNLPYQYVLMLCLIIQWLIGLPTQQNQLLIKNKQFADNIPTMFYRFQIIMIIDIH